VAEERYSALYTTMSVIALAVLLRLTAGEAVAVVFTAAVLATVSMPAVYAMSYTSAKVRGAGRFVRRKGEGLDAGAEALALLSSYALGLLVFYALSGYFDVVLYTLAYACSQAMRALNVLAIRAYERAGADPGNPLLVLLAAFGAASLLLPALLLLFRLIS